MEEGCQYSAVALILIKTWMGWSLVLWYIWLKLNLNKTCAWTWVNGTTRTSPWSYTSDKTKIAFSQFLQRGHLGIGYKIWQSGSWWWVDV